MRDSRILLTVFLAGCFVFCLGFLDSGLVACTSMLFGKTQKYLAYNYDFFYDHGEVIYQPRGIQKSVLREQTYPLISWKSRFATLTFQSVA